MTTLNQSPSCLPLIRSPLQKYKQSEDDQPIERLRKVHEVFKMKPQQTNLFREQGKSRITPPTTTFKKEESLVTKRNFPCHWSTMSVKWLHKRESIIEGAAYCVIVHVVVGRYKVVRSLPRYKVALVPWQWPVYRSAHLLARERLVVIPADLSLTLGREHWLAVSSGWFDHRALRL